MKSAKRLTYVSLFSGCGGFDLGFKQNAFECLAAYDIDPNVIKVHQKNIGGKSYVHDLLDSNLPGIEALKNVDIVCSGSPCQGFSTVGKRRLNDPRNKLLLVGGEIAIKLKAKVFVAENVMGSTAGNHNKYWLKLEKLLTSNEYNVHKLFCDATKLGMAQLRKRVILIAWKGRSDITFDLPVLESRSLKQALDDLKDVANHDIDMLSNDDITLQIAKHIKPHQKLSNVRAGARSVHTWDIPVVFGNTNLSEKKVLEKVMRLRRQLRTRNFGDADPVYIKDLQENLPISIKKVIDSLVNKGYLKYCGENRVDLVNTFNGKYRRLSWGNPSPTVDTRFGNPKYFLHPEENRGFTPREAARIQGFPDNFVFYGTLSQQFKMIGNAVPPPMAYEIGKLIKNNIFN